MANRPTISITCKGCCEEFDKDRREYNRQQKNGKTNFYCSIACSSKAPRKSYNRTRSQAFIDANFRKTDEYTPFRYYMRKALQRGKLGDITLSSIKELWDRQDGKCAFIGIPLMLNTKGKQDLRFLASLDRIDSSLPYQDGNVQFVSASLNYAKSTMTDTMFREFLTMIVESAGQSVR